jgi:MFS family permease
MSSNTVAQEASLTTLGEFRTGAPSLIGSLLCIVLGPAVVGFYTFSLLLGPLGEVTGQGRTALSLTVTIGTLAAAFSAPWLGRLIEHYSVRRVLIPSSIALGLVMILLYALASTVIGLYVMFVAIGVLCSAYYIAIPRAISSLFDRHRGLALGITMSGTGLGTFIVMPLVQHVISEHGWRASYAFLGMLILCVAVPCALFLVRPAQGDGDGRAGTPKAAANAIATQGVCVPMLSRNFLLLAGTYLLIGVALDGVVIHFVPILTARRLSSADATSLYALAGMTIFAGRIGCGLLMDRLRANRVGAALFLLSACGILLLQLGVGTGSLHLGAALFGLGVGAELDVLGYLVSRLFALNAFARTYGLIYGSFMIGTSFGPLLFGYLFDRSGNYEQVAWLAASLTLLAAVLLFVVQLGPRDLQGEFRWKRIETTVSNGGCRPVRLSRRRCVDESSTAVSSRASG